MHNPELWEEDRSHSWEHVYEFYGLEDEDEYDYSDAEGEEGPSVVDEEEELAG